MSNPRDGHVFTRVSHYLQFGHGRHSPSEPRTNALPHSGHCAMRPTTGPARSAGRLAANSSADTVSRNSSANEILIVFS